MRCPSPHAQKMVSLVGIAPRCLPVVLILMRPATPLRASDNDRVPSRSTNICLTGDQRKLLNVNFEANSVTVFRVRDESKSSPLIKLGEIPVGREPHSIAVHPDDSMAFVTNSASSTVSVIALEGDKANRVIREIPVGTEPRGCALTRSGRLLFVANHTAGTVSVIDTDSLRVIRTLMLGGNPTAIAITSDGKRNNSGDRSNRDRSSRGDRGDRDDDDEGDDEDDRNLENENDDRDETVFVTQFFAELIPGGPGEGFDNGKEGVIHAFRVKNLEAVTRITLSPLGNSGFVADRTPFCTKLNANAANDTFCPDPNEPNPESPAIKADPQAVFPNQLYAALIRNLRLYAPNIGAQPEPPVRFNVNVQALVHVVDTRALAEVPDLNVNLNAQIAKEPDPANPAESLGRLFGNDIVAIDADRKGKELFIVSRGGNYVLRVKVASDGKLDIGAPDGVVRFQTGNIPTGIVVSSNGKRAYVNNEVGLSVSVIDLESETVLARDVASSTPPEPGSFAHAALVGKLVFHTALGVPDNGLSAISIRELNPLQFRGKQSNNAWSTCASCHPGGLSDHVTWIFPDGPRQTLPLDGLYSKVNGAHDVRISNWSAARDSVTDFNNNSRAVQGGVGFASDPPFSAQAPNPVIFDHGFSQGASDALDLETLWTQTVRSLNMPQLGTETELNAGATVFANRCASCHGGAKWTKSQVVYLNNPALDKAFAAGGTPRDPGLTVTANQVVSYADPKVDTKALKLLEGINTFDPAGAIEVRGAGAAIGQRALGTLGFNVPALLGTGYHPPYLHNGEAQTLEAVFPLHALPEGGSIQSALNDADRAALLIFLKSIDGRTPTFISDTDIFRNPTVNLP